MVDAVGGDGMGIAEIGKGGGSTWLEYSQGDPIFDIIS